MSTLEADPNVRFMDAMAPFVVEGTDDHYRKSLVLAIPGGTPAAERQLEIQKIETFNSEDLQRELAAIGYGHRTYYDVMSDEVIDQMRDEKNSAHPMELDKNVAYALLGILLIENGHAEYDRILSGFFEGQEDFKRWKNAWVGDEKTHGDAIEKWAWLSGALDMKKVYAATQALLRHGLMLDFQTAADGVVYPSFQEDATEGTYNNTVSELPTRKESFSAGIGRQILGLVMRVERHHKEFYTEVTRKGLDTGDVEITSMLMLAIMRAVMGFAMPAIETDMPRREAALTMAGFRRKNIFTPVTLASDILIPVILGGPDDSQTGKYGWDIANVTALSDDAKQAQATVIDFAEGLKKRKGDAGGTLELITEARQKYGRVA